MLDAVKIALRIKTNAYDEELKLLIEAAKLDLKIAGVVLPASSSNEDDLIKIAIITYCKMNFGNPPNYVDLKKSFDEQKAQLSNADGYTEWKNV